MSNDDVNGTVNLFIQELKQLTLRDIPVLEALEQTLQNPSSSTQRVAPPPIVAGNSPTAARANTPKTTTTPPNQTFKIGYFVVITNAIRHTNDRPIARNNRIGVVTERF
jgi:hypothetical protein